MDIHGYWNDIDLEKKKAFWIESESDPKLKRFLQEETNLERCFLDALDLVARQGLLRGHILDVGAGVAWTSAIVSRRPDVSRVTALDISEHRLKKIAPLVFRQFDGRTEKFEPVVGDLMGSLWPMASFDVVIFCQALYHFQDIRRTLEKVRELLSPGGVVMVCCERITSELPLLSPGGLKRRLKVVLGQRKDRSGNHLWTDKEYRQGIEGAGLQYSFQELGYPVYPGNTSFPAGNHFGVKQKGLVDGHK